MLKRVFDFVFAFFALLIASPVLLICGILIKLNSKGPVFFKQIRVGLDGQLFKIYKFRTMVNRSDQKGSQVTARNDSRITSIGHILRWTKLDELPQLINVLKGEMSLVGPRPEVPSIVNYYTETQKQVLSVTPGIVGVNQILRRNESDEYPDGIEDTEGYYIKHILPEKLKYDLEYVKKHSFLYDLKLLLGGILATLIGAPQARIFIESKLPAFLVPIDVMLIIFSYFLAYDLRFEWKIPEEEFRILLMTLPIVLVIRMSIFFLFKIYKTLWKYVSVRDFVTIFKATTLSSILIIGAVFFGNLRLASRSIFVIDWMLTFFFIGGIRFFLRIIKESDSLSKVGFIRHPIRKNVLIVGAGNVGEMLFRELKRDDKYKFHVVGFVDDDDKKIGKTIHGVKVLGNRKSIPDLIAPFNVDEVFLAIPNISSDEIRNIIRYCEQANVKYRIVPAVIDLLSGHIYLSKIRNVEISDLFGRKPIKLDFSAICEFISNRRVLVTGAGGSIGSELCRQIAEYKPKRLILVDRNENYLHEIQCELKSNFPGLSAYFKIADITDEEKMDKFFHAYEPEIVFHAAAQKHVPLSERNPDEAIKNNIIGTKILARLADRYKVSHFVMISTDKAVNPTSIMGVTKRAAELYIQSFSATSYTKFITVRFGNVMNSNGSVVPMFLRQIERGGPVTVTHPEIERFFMSIPEAVQLVLQAITMGKNREIFILDMGESIKIVDLAIELIKRAGLKPNEDIEIKFTGLRPGEKMFEELIGQDEEVIPTRHSHVKTLKSNHVPNIEILERLIHELSIVSKGMDYIKIKEKIKEIVPEYTAPEIEVKQRMQPFSSSNLVQKKSVNVALSRVYAST